MIYQELIRERINNFLGYGDFTSKIWFIGMEEGGKEGNSEKEYKELFERTKGQSFVDINQSEFDKSWDKNFFMLYRLIFFLEKDIDFFDRQTSNKILRDYKENEMGKINKKSLSNCYLEFNPLPLRTKSSYWYEYITQQLKYKDKYGFLDMIKENRFNLIKRKIREYSPKCVIFYGLSYKCYYLDAWMFELIKSKPTIYYSKEGKTKLFIIPHCSAKFISKKDYRLIGEEIKKRIK